MTPRLIRVTVLPGVVVYAADSEGDRRAHVEGEVFEASAAEAKTLQDDGLVEPT